jgi:glycosyltransferase involved in cell wall biosynthesis
MERLSGLGRIAPERTRVIHNGIDTTRFSPSPRRSDGPLTLICVARLDPLKSHDLLVRSLAALRSQGLDTRLRIVGDGPTRAAVEDEIARLNLGDRVELLGVRSDVPDLLATADIFVLPSMAEGLPMTVIEAMACGLPVIASDVGGVSELVASNVNGLLVHARNQQALTDALRLLVTDAGLRRRMGAAGRRMAERQFDIRITARLHAELFRDLLAQKGCSAETRVS